MNQWNFSVFPKKYHNEYHHEPWNPWVSFWTLQGLGLQVLPSQKSSLRSRPEETAALIYFQYQTHFMIRGSLISRYEGQILFNLYQGGGRRRGRWPGRISQKWKHMEKSMFPPGLRWSQDMPWCFDFQIRPARLPLAPLSDQMCVYVHTCVCVSHTCTCIQAHIHICK